MAWPYASGPRHLGHAAGAYVPPDIFARYHRMAGNHVLMVSGSDMHGTPITVAADKLGVSARELAEENHPGIAESFRRLGLSYDLYTTTLTPIHYRVTQDFFSRLLEQGYLFQDTQPAMYRPGGEALSARPLRRRHLSALWLHRRPRRPVRQLRAHARPDRSDRPALQALRRHAGDARDDALLPRSAEVPGAPASLGGRGIGPLAAGRDGLRAGLAEGGAATARDHPRSRLGRADPAGRVRRQAHLRLVRRGDRLSLGVDGVGGAAGRPGGLEAVVGAATKRATPPAGPTTSSARTTSRSTPSSGRRC